MVGIVSNSAALFAQRNLNAAAESSESSIAKLSSGSAIVSASDDVAGLAVGTVLRTQVSTLRTILSATSQAGSLLGIADAGLKNIGDILQRQKSLAVQSNTGSLSDNERAFLDQEFQNLITEIDRIVDNTTFNGINLLNGSLSSSGALSVDDPAAAGDFIVDGSLGAAAFTATGALTIAGVNGDLIGALSSADVNVTGTDGALFISLEVNGESYTSTAASAIAGGSVDVVLENSESGQTITLANLAQNTTITNATHQESVAADIEADLAAITIYQDRGFDTTSTITTTTLDGTALEGLDGSDFELRSVAFDVTNDLAPSIGAFSVTAETTETDGIISVTIGGSTYRTVSGFFDGSATGIQGVNYGDGAGIVRLYLDGDSTNNSNDYFEINFNSAENTSLDIDTSGSATGIESALNTAFGSGEAGGVTFQVGQTASDNISLTLDSAATTSIYLNDSSIYTALSVDTAANAQTASDVLDNAIDTVTSLRATVGALQSRIDFAAANVTASIQNTEAARSVFLDVDIADESTRFATAQVQLQASISVLAQANQIPQNLLKLIG